MSVSELCQSIETTAIGRAIPHFTWLWPAIESIHVGAMVVLLASIATFDVRLMELALHEFRISQLSRRLLPVTWCAFGLMVLTGSFLFIPFAQRKYCFNSSFQVKLALIVLAGVNMAVFHLSAYRKVHSWDEKSTPLAAKMAAGVSVLLWAGGVAWGA